MRTIQYEQRGEKYKQTQTRLIRSLVWIAPKEKDPEKPDVPESLEIEVREIFADLF
jgi:hypothetical protein